MWKNGSMDDYFVSYHLGYKYGKTYVTNDVLSHLFNLQNA